MRPFAVVPEVLIPEGGSSFTTGRVGYRSASSARGPALLVERGRNFYDGDRTSVSLTRGRLNVSPRFSVEPSFSVNRVELSMRALHTTIAASRATCTMTPRMFVSGLVQLDGPRRQRQRPVPLGVQPRQRALRRLQRGA
ncbi:MAG: hypothetical protein R2712_08450 [Vicinamibacterales bacterium]